MMGVANENGVEFGVVERSEIGEGVPAFGARVHSAIEDDAAFTIKVEEIRVRPDFVTAGQISELHWEKVKGKREKVKGQATD
jgi:hypothetical protein